MIFFFCLQTLACVTSNFAHVSFNVFCNIFAFFAGLCADMYACSCLIVCVTLEGDGPSGSGLLNILFLGDFLVLGSCVCRYDGKVGNMVGTEPFFRK